MKKNNKTSSKDQRIIETCSKTGEPTFCLRAQDACALPTLLAYKELAKGIKAEPKFIQELDNIINRFQKFSVNKIEKIKTPD